MCSDLIQRRLPSAAIFYYPRLYILICCIHAFLAPIFAVVEERSPQAYKLFLAYAELTALDRYLLDLARSGLYRHLAVEQALILP